MFGQPQFKVSASVNFDGEPTVSVTAVCDYGSRSAAHSEEVTDEKVLEQIGKALNKALTADVKASLAQTVTAHAAEAFVVANQRGEQI